MNRKKKVQVEIFDRTFDVSSVLLEARQWAETRNPGWTVVDHGLEWATPREDDGRWVGVYLVLETEIN